MSCHEGGLQLTCAQATTAGASGRNARALLSQTGAGSSFVPCDNETSIHQLTHIRHTTITTNSDDLRTPIDNLLISITTI